MIVLQLFFLLFLFLSCVYVSVKKRSRRIRKNLLFSYLLAKQIKEKNIECVYLGTFQDLN